MPRPASALLAALRPRGRTRWVPARPSPRLACLASPAGPPESRSSCVKPKSARGGACFGLPGGESGIRTHGREALQRFSKPSPSATQPSLRGIVFDRLLNVIPGRDFSIELGSLEPPDREFHVKPLDVFFVICLDGFRIKQLLDFIVTLMREGGCGTAFAVDQPN